MTDEPELLESEIKYPTEQAMLDDILGEYGFEAYSRGPDDFLRLMRKMEDIARRDWKKLNSEPYPVDHCSKLEAFLKGPVKPFMVVVTALHGSSEKKIETEIPQNNLLLQVYLRTRIPYNAFTYVVTDHREVFVRPPTVPLTEEEERELFDECIFSAPEGSMENYGFALVKWKRSDLKKWLRVKSSFLPGRVSGRWTFPSLRLNERSGYSSLYHSMRSSGSEYLLLCVNDRTAWHKEFEDIDRLQLQVDLNGNPGSTLLAVIGNDVYLRAPANVPMRDPDVDFHMKFYRASRNQ